MSHVTWVPGFRFRFSGKIAFKIWNLTSRIRHRDNNCLTGFQRSRVARRIDRDHFWKVTKQRTISKLINIIKLFRISKSFHPFLIVFELNCNCAINVFLSFTSVARRTRANPQEKLLRSRSLYVCYRLQTRIWYLSSASTFFSLHKIEHPQENNSL